MHINQNKKHVHAASNPRKQTYMHKQPALHTKYVQVCKTHWNTKKSMQIDLAHFFICKHAVLIITGSLPNSNRVLDMLLGWCLTCVSAQSLGLACFSTFSFANMPWRYVESSDSECEVLDEELWFSLSWNVLNFLFSGVARLSSPSVVLQELDEKQLQYVECGKKFAQASGFSILTHRGFENQLLKPVETHLSYKWLVDLRSWQIPIPMGKSHLHLWQWLHLGYYFLRASVTLNSTWR